MTIDLWAGPDALSYIRALIRIEQEWLGRYARSFPPPFDSHSNGSPQSHIDLLEHLHTLAPHIIPDEFSQGVLWHSDLHAANIFLDSKKDPRIAGIIDWQGMSVLPLYLQAVLADFLVYKGTDVIIHDGLVKPTYRVPLEEAPQRIRSG